MQMSRRNLLAGAAGAGGLSLLPSWAATLSPNEKANVAFIGIGSYGAVNLVELASQNIVAVCDVDWRDRSQIPGHGGLVTEICLLGNIAIAQRGTQLTFDPKARRFTNSTVANQLFHRSSRKGWELPV